MADQVGRLGRAEVVVLVGWGERGARIVGCAGGLIAAARAAFACALIASVLSAIAALAAFTAVPAEAAGKVALVIGNAAYQYTRPLNNPRNDAEAVAKLLGEIGFAPADVMLHTDLGHAGMVAALRTFIDKSTGADTALVYYAGHGIEVAGENYLVPVDAKLARDVDLEYEAVTLASVLKVVGGARKLKLVILDACRTNPQADRIVLRGDVKRATARGLWSIEPGGDVLVAYAAKHGTAALDGAGRHSPYAEALLKHMATPGLDVLRMLGRVKETVLEATGRQQEPWFYGSPGGDTVSLVSAKVELQLPPLPGGSGGGPVSAPGGATGSGLTSEAVRICREVEGMSNLAILGTLAAQYKGTTAGACIATRIAELQQAADATAKGEREREEQKAAEARAKAEREREALRQAEQAREELRKAELAREELRRAEERAREERRRAEEAKQKAAEEAEIALSSPLRKRTVPDLSLTLPNLRPKIPEITPAPAPASTECDRLTDLDFENIDARRAVPACREAIARYPTEARLQDALAVALDKAGSLTEARSWYEKAAAQGNAKSMNSLGFLYDTGRGVPKSHATARQWYAKAANLGEAIAMHNLAMLLDSGNGGGRDPQGAARHLLASARAGDNVARTDLDGGMSSWSYDTIRAVQQLLVDAGDYTGTIDGQWGPASRDAAKAYYGRAQ